MGLAISSIMLTSHIDFSPKVCINFSITNENKLCP